MAKTAVITGATKGLGRAAAEVFAANGFDLCVCARTARDLEAMKADWVQQYPGRDLRIFSADLSRKQEVLAFGNFVRSTCPKLDVLLNNAGLYLPGLVTEEPDGNLETLMDTNLYSAYHLTRALLPLMLPHKQGHVFNMCSIASLMAYPNASSYSITKFALLGFSRALREELKEAGIKVTAVMPGNTWSDAWKGATIPRERLMPASDVAQAIWGCYTLSGAAVVEELVLRPQLGDL